MAQKTGVQSQVKSYQRLKKKNWDDASLLYSQHYKVRIKGKWNNPGKGVAPFPIPWCTSYCKVDLWATLDYGRPTYIIRYNNFKRGHGEDINKYFFIKSFWTIVFVFIVFFFTTFQLLYLKFKNDFPGLIISMPRGHLRKAGGYNARNVVKKNNQDKDNSPKTLTDKNHQTSSQKFRQLIAKYLL